MFSQSGVYRWKNAEPGEYSSGSSMFHPAFSRGYPVPLVICYIAMV